MVRQAHKTRVMLDFVDASTHLLKTGGFKNVSIRKTAVLAGYNSATLYNYFNNLDHLLFISSMQLMKNYLHDLESRIKKDHNAMDVFLLVWDSFCQYAFDAPELYHTIFFTHEVEVVDQYLMDYYELFPGDVMSSNDTIKQMVGSLDISARGLSTINQCVKEGFLKREDANRVNEITIFIFKGILDRVLRDQLDANEAKKKAMDYIVSIVRFAAQKDYSFDDFLLRTHSKR